MIKTIPVRRRPRVVFPALVLAALLLPHGARGESTLNDLFQRGKTESKVGNYQASLATFQQLDESSRQPGNEAARAKLEPLIAFYRGVNLAALGQKEAAEKEFDTYLTSFPTAHLDPAMFPRAAIDVFDKARERTAAQSQAAGGSRKPAEESAIALDYASFRTGSDRPAAFDPKWGDGAIRFLMTKHESESWQRIQDPQQRAEFVTRFWQRRDPNPLTPENEFRDEIERRIRYADARFAADEKRGSETDRGMVFVLLGPPSYIGQRPFRSDDDSIQAARNAPTQEVVGLDAQGRKIIRSVPRDALTTETIQGTKETWYYRRDRLPKEIRFPEVDFEFITKKGLGVAVLQRDHTILVTLDLAAKATLPREN